MEVPTLLAVGSNNISRSNFQINAIRGLQHEVVYGGSCGGTK